MVHSSSFTISNADGVVLLQSREINLKITSDRVLWRNIPGKDSSKFVDTHKKVPYGLSIRQKEIFLVELRRSVLNKLDNVSDVAEQNKEQPESDNGSVNITLDDDDAEKEHEV